MRSFKFEQLLSLELQRNSFPRGAIRAGEHSFWRLVQQYRTIQYFFSKGGPKTKKIVEISLNFGDDRCLITKCFLCETILSARTASEYKNGMYDQDKTSKLPPQPFIL